MEGIALREGLTATSELNWEGKACLVLVGLDNKTRPFRISFSPAEQQELLDWVKVLMDKRVCLREDPEIL